MLILKDERGWRREWADLVLNFVSSQCFVLMETIQQESRNPWIFDTSGKQRDPRSSQCWEKLQSTSRMMGVQRDGWSQIQCLCPLSGQLLDVSGVSARISKGEFLVSDHLNCSSHRTAGNRTWTSLRLQFMLWQVLTHPTSPPSGRSSPITVFTEDQQLFYLLHLLFNILIRITLWL